MRRFFQFWWLCARNAFRGNTAFANDWQWLIGYPAIAIVLWLLAYSYAEWSGRIEVTLSTAGLGALVAAFIAFLVSWIARFIIRFWNTPVELDHQKSERIADLEKVDHRDLEHMLGGRYLNKNTFMYGAEGTVCKNYQNKFDLRRLTDGFDMISVRAPKNSWADINFQFLNARQESHQYLFYVLDENGKQAAYEIDANASLRVDVKSWTK